MNHGSLFSGIGGFDLAAQWMDWNNVFHCEWNEFGQRVLKHYWPEAISYADITKTDFTVHRGKCDIITGGFPCQPYSVAGKRKGKEDERHLWPEMLRAIREIQPSYVVGENVRGLVNWNGGLVFDEVQADLESEGFEVIPFLLPAVGVNAPHRRDRIWFVAYSSRNGHESRRPRKNRFSEGKSKSVEEQRERIWTNDRGTSEPGITTNSSHERLQRRENNGGFGDSGTKRKQFTTGLLRPEWQNFPTQSPICNGDDGLSARLDGITFPKWRNESIKAGGNAIVPQVAYQIFKAIQETK